MNRPSACSPVVTHVRLPNRAVGLGIAAAVMAVAVALTGAVGWLRPTPPTPAVIGYAEGVTMRLHVPGRIEGAPTVVLLHGCCGDPADVTQLALVLADRGLLVANAGWTTLDDGGGWPRSYGEAICAVAVARDQARELGARADRIVLVGWSDGALLTTVAGLAPPPPAQGCLVADDGRPEAVVALAGFFGGGQPGPRPAEGRNRDATAAWFGGSRAQVPEAWRAGDPLALLSAGLVEASTLQVDLVVGRDDPLARDAERFARAARGFVHDIRLHVVPGDHIDVVLPRTAAGARAADVIVARAGEP